MENRWDIFRNINDWVKFSDAKAAVILAFAGGSASFLASKIELINKIIIAHMGQPAGYLLFWSFFLFWVSLAGTVFCAFKVLWPTLKSSNDRSLLYFRHICEDFGGDHLKYSEALDGLTEIQMRAEIAHQICANASIANKKFNWVSRAIRCLVALLALWFFIVLLLLLLAGTIQQT